jgi:hypothetical protein
MLYYSVGVSLRPYKTRLFQIQQKPINFWSHRMISVNLLKNRLSPPSNEPRLSAVHAFFAWFGGSVLALLKKCEKPVQQARSMRGRLLFVTVLVSSLLAGLAWALVSQDIWTGVAVGVVWFGLMAALDQNLMSQMDGTAARGKTAILLIFRLGIIVVMAHLNSHFVQLWMFNTEIEAVLAEKRQDKIANADDKLSTARKGYDTWYKAERNRIDDALAAARKARLELTDEISGKGGSGRPGYAQIARTKEEGLKREETNLLKEEATFLETAKSGVEARALKRAEESHSEVTTQIKGKKKEGLVDRSEALEEVASNNPLVHWMYGLFMILETLAFLVKLLSKQDEYDNRVDREREVSALKFEEEDLEEEGRIRDLIVEAAEKDAEARTALATHYGTNQTATAQMLASLEAEALATANHAGVIHAAEKQMKEAGVPAKVREKILGDAHGNIVNIRKFRA